MNKFIMSFVTMFIFCAIFAVTTVFTQRTKVSIYYESLCPYSILFVRDEFYPNYEELKEYIEMDWIPYGKANQTYINGEWVFMCQHGDDECRANKYQACVLNLHKDQDTSVEFIYCMLSLNYPAHTPSIRNCAKIYNLNWNDITNCFHNGRGDELLAHLGYRTNNLNPPLKTVPTIVYNDRFSEELWKSALANFLQTTCSQIETTPQVC